MEKKLGPDTVSLPELRANLIHWFKMKGMIHIEAEQKARLLTEYCNGQGIKDSAKLLEHVEGHKDWFQLSTKFTDRDIETLTVLIRYVKSVVYHEKNPQPAHKNNPAGSAFHDIVEEPTSGTQKPNTPARTSSPPYAELFLGLLIVYGMIVRPYVIHGPTNSMIFAAWQALIGLIVYGFIIRPIGKIFLPKLARRLQPTTNSLAHTLQPAGKLLGDIYFRRGAFKRDWAYHKAFSLGNVVLTVLGYWLLFIVLGGFGALVAGAVWLIVTIGLPIGFLATIWAWGPAGGAGSIAFLLFMEKGSFFGGGHAKAAHTDNHHPAASVKHDAHPAPKTTKKGGGDHGHGHGH